MAKGQAAKKKAVPMSTMITGTLNEVNKKKLSCRLGFSIDIHPSITLATGGEGINAFDFGLPFEIQYAEAGE
jgi:hypothetical protein